MFDEICVALGEEDNMEQSLTDTKEIARKIMDINEIAYTIDNTTKTRAIFEINKGVNKKNGEGVNAKMSDGQRRVSFKNMIYIADIFRIC